jgi:hypothetical protein
MASLVLYCGAGVNVMSYCCNDCRTKGVTAIMENECCDIHDREHSDNQPYNTESHHINCTHPSEKDCCSFERINFEWNTTYNLAKSEFYELVQKANLPSYIILSENTDTEEFTVKKLRQKDPPILLPREYLSALSVLLI